jgi:antitoxin (DNA-binding transcriptional repressor) of toxin-antitoxin stability system
MKTVTAREFYHNAGLVDGLLEGERLVVTSNGKPKFAVVKLEGKRPRMTVKKARETALGSADAPKFDGVAFLKTLKK